MARHRRGAIPLRSGLRKQKWPKRQCAACRRALHSEVKRLLRKIDDLETDLSVLKEAAAEAVAQAPEQQRNEGDSFVNLEDFDGVNLEDFDNGFDWEKYGVEGPIQQELT
ncbi:hypothetical protein ColLi_12355 [Colletotrichum liriopes]|uniref:Uncharacterized protein n=1 Tax=Colletotrichum liriopes TaxID=708192 RepID=A0AA37LYL1_9PEZI|nr:hypothetical protein ColLi_12355 [Colletotrichum liriopes]